jgi:hypothetical protein
MIRLRPGLPAARVVGTEEQSVDDRARLLGVGEGVVKEPRHRPPDPLARPGDRGRGRADRIRVQLVRGPEADQDDSPGRSVPVRVQHGRSPGFRADLILVGDTPGVIVPRERGQPLRADWKREDIRLRNRI